MVWYTVWSRCLECCSVVALIIIVVVDHHRSRLIQISMLAARGCIRKFVLITQISRSSLNSTAIDGTLTIGSVCRAGVSGADLKAS